MSDVFYKLGIFQPVHRSEIILEWQDPETYYSSDNFRRFVVDYSRALANRKWLSKSNFATNPLYLYFCLFHGISIALVFLHKPVHPGHSKKKDKRKTNKQRIKTLTVSLQVSDGR